MLAVHQLMEENFSKPFQTFERRNEAIPGFYAANELNNLGNNRFQADSTSNMKYCQAFEGFGAILPTGHPSQ